MKIEIGCYCGNEFDADIQGRHDFLKDGEDMDTVMVNCPICGMKARVWVGVSVEDYGKEPK